MAEINILQENKESNSISVNFSYILFKYLFLHVGIKNLEGIEGEVLEKFLVYWFPRVYMNASEEEIREVISQTKVLIQAWPIKANFTSEYFDELEEELLRIRGMSLKISRVRQTINRLRIKGGKNIWIKEDKKSEMISAYFTYPKDCPKGSVVVNIKNNKAYLLKNKELLETIGMRNEIIRLEICKTSEHERGWEIINIGLIYSEKCKKFIL